MSSGSQLLTGQDHPHPSVELRAPRAKRLRRVLAFARPHRFVALVVVLLTLVGAAVGAAEPLVLKSIFDAVAEAGPGSARAALVSVGILAALTVLREISSGLSNWLTWRTRLRLHYALLDATVERLHRLPVDYHRAQGVGAVMTRLDRGIQGFIGAIGEIAFNVIPSVAYLVFAVILMLQLDWRLTALVVVFAPLPGLVAALASPTQVRREQNLLDRWSRIYSRFNEVLSGLVTVRSYAMEDVEKRRFLEQVRDANEVVVRGVAYDTRVGALQNGIIAVARLGAIGFGGWLAVNGHVTVGTVVAFLGYVQGMFGPVQGLTNVYRTLKLATVSVDTVFSILDAQEHIGDAPDAVDPGPFEGRIEIEDVRFRYRDDMDPVLDGVTMSVRPGETVALVGPSGAGKSTLTALMQRLYDPDDGVVRIDGEDVRRYKQRSLRAQIGVVLQDPLLFNDTIRNNIAYGRADATLDEIQSVARAARAHDFVSKLPLGYDTVVGERGGSLSVGERQRIAIARALLKDPPIVILDEATSALDAETEALVQQALGQLLENRTAIVIAHRLSTVVDADRIVVLRHGRIVEEGPHRELVARGGYYADLVRRQTRGLLPDLRDD